jgi:hypothetical protein
MRDTIELAREANLAKYGNGLREGVPAFINALKAFEALVRADAIAGEREACAKVCDDGYDTFFANNGVEHSRKRYDQRAVERAIRAGVEFVTADCATAIRARGNT